jgi:hypothetical protein
MRKTVHEWLDGHKHDKRPAKKKLPGQKRSKRPPFPPTNADPQPPPPTPRKKKKRRPK